MTDKILVVIPARNEEEFIGRVIEGLGRQKIKPLLTLIIDDGSTDDTIKEVKKAMEKTMIKYKILQRKDRGFTLDGEASLAQVYNDGFKSVNLSEFDYLLINGADSLLSDDYFEKMLKHFHENPNLVISSGTCPSEAIDRDHVHGSAGRFYNMVFFIDVCKGKFEISYAWESIPVFLANINNKIAMHFSEPLVYHLRPRNTRAEPKVFYFRGLAMREVGYWFPYALGRVLANAMHEKSIKYAILMLVGYFRGRGLSSKHNFTEDYKNYQKKVFMQRMKRFFNKIIT
ncbi:MAG TPA: glycosyltransferase family A protein [Candidatus Bathyarchaeia archaeon]|nr:glycosyltransferase family A protein [Candidatus Bathyarchaeia archaeon]